MNGLLAQGPSITSREIAELVNLRHDNVKRTIETLVSQGVITSPQSEEIPTATRRALVFVFSGEQGKRDSIVVVAQLSPSFTAKLVDRWLELERRMAPGSAGDGALEKWGVAYVEYCTDREHASRCGKDLAHWRGRKLVHVALLERLDPQIKLPLSAAEPA